MKPVKKKYIFPREENVFRREFEALFMFRTPNISSRPKQEYTVINILVNEIHVKYDSVKIRINNALLCGKEEKNILKLDICVYTYP